MSKNEAEPVEGAVQEDSARNQQRLQKESDVLMRVTDLPPYLMPVIVEARRKLQDYSKQDVYAAGMMIRSLQAFLTEREHYAAWRKRAEEAEAEIAALRVEQARVEDEWVRIAAQNAADANARFTALISSLQSIIEEIKEFRLELFEEAAQTIQARPVAERLAQVITRLQQILISPDQPRT